VRAAAAVPVAAVQVAATVAVKQLRCCSNSSANGFVEDDTYISVTERAVMTASMWICGFYKENTKLYSIGFGGTILQCDTFASTCRELQSGCTPSVLLQCCAIQVIDECCGALDTINKVITRSSLGESDAHVGPRLKITENNEVIM